jgi:hypothetical protein
VRDAKSGRDEAAAMGSGLVVWLEPDEPLICLELFEYQNLYSYVHDYALSARL